RRDKMSRTRLRHAFDTREDGFMIRNDLRGLGTAIVMMAALVSTGNAQTSSSPAAPTQTPAAAPPPAGDSVIVVEKPTYVTIALETTVNRPVAEVWKRIGGYCAIGEWFQMAAGCKILSGTDNEIGAVRSVANEVLVVKSQYSYTYTQPVRAGRPYNLYHGTLEARPLTETTSTLLYTLVYDNSMLPDDAAREKDRASRTATFTRALANMKTLAEGGTLPPR
ncbi:MAG TPA: SRPBCC family protein, partial [Vicinamibacterales bacterium]|nr:SRPBCC family protein [Vicinamibacterales bacterium]